MPDTAADAATAFPPSILATAAPAIPAARAWAAAYRGAAGPAIDLTQAVPGYPPHPDLLVRLGTEAARTAHAGCGPIEGEPGLREVLAADLAQRYRAPLDAAVVITAGCNLAFAMTMTAIAGPGSAVLLPAPWYFNHHMALTMLGIATIPLPCRAEDGFVPDPRQAEALIDGRACARVLATPNNPTGRVYPPATIAAFAALCRRRGIVLVLDETYRDFLPGEAPPHAMFADASWRNGLLHLYSFSKSYCVPGHRVGAILAGPSIRAQLLKVLDTLQIWRRGRRRRRWPGRCRRWPPGARATATSCRTRGGVPAGPCRAAGVAHRRARRLLRPSPLAGRRGGRAGDRGTAGRGARADDAAGSVLRPGAGAASAPRVRQRRRGDDRAAAHAARLSTRPWSRRSVVLALGAAAAGCDTRVPLDRTAPVPLRRIGVVSPAVAATPAAPTNLPLVSAFGSIGRFVDAALEAERNRRLAELLRSEGYRALERWTTHLMLALAEAGYRPVAVPVARFDLGFLARYPPAAVDAYLDTVVPEYGFVADMPDGPFVPFAAVSMRLVDPRGRVLFQDRLVMHALRPFDAVPVTGPAEPLLAGEGWLTQEADRTVAGVDAALGMMAAHVAARLR